MLTRFDGYWRLLLEIQLFWKNTDFQIFWNFHQISNISIVFTVVSTQYFHNSKVEWVSSRVRNLSESVQRHFQVQGGAREVFARILKIGDFQENPWIFMFFSWKRSVLSRFRTNFRIYIRHRDDVIDGWFANIDCFSRDVPEQIFDFLCCIQKKLRFFIVYWYFWKTMDFQCFSKSWNEVIFDGYFFKSTKMKHQNFSLKKP